MPRQVRLVDEIILFQREKQSAVSGGGLPLVGNFGSISLFIKSFSPQ